MRTKKLVYFILSAALGLGLSKAQPRFDHLVRNDFFSGFTGNKEALARGMVTTEKILAENPNHAEALVWHGAGIFFESGQQFRLGNPEKGMELYQKALAEMDRAVQLEPDNIGVRIPRGAALLGAARSMGKDNPIVPSLFERALSDHMRAYELQKDTMDRMGEHPKGELLFALGDVNSRLGKPEEAEKFFQLILEKLPNTPYAKRAATWMETKQPLPAAQSTCIGCHVTN
jgi:tetratricopeptide (TPR) repeat protein